MNFDDFYNRNNGKFLDFELFARPLSWQMVLNVFRPAHYYQIFNSIVGFITIYVMYNLATKQLSVKVFLHDNPMFSFMPGIFALIFTNIARLINRTALPSWVMSMVGINIGSVAFSGAKYFFAFFVALIISKFLHTLVATKHPKPKRVIAFATAKSSILRWRGIKNALTLFTNIFHNNIIPLNAWSC